MKRDMKLVRLLLISLEGEKEVNLSDYTNDEVNYHKKLIIEENLAKGTITPNSDGISDIPLLADLKRLTWKGHEFLEHARNDNV